MEDKRTYIKPEWRKFGMPTAAASCRPGADDVGIEASCSIGNSPHVGYGTTCSTFGDSANVTCLTGFDVGRDCFTGNSAFSCHTGNSPYT